MKKFVDLNGENYEETERKRKKKSNAKKNYSRIEKRKSWKVRDYKTELSLAYAEQYIVTDFCENEENRFFGSLVDD